MSAILPTNNFSASLSPKTRERLSQEAARRGLRVASLESRFDRYQTLPALYAEEVLGLTPWAGRNAKGQRELFDDIGESVRMQLAGETLPDGSPPPQTFRVEAGHGVGKSFGAAMLVNWFFDCFTPSITMTTAPSKQQVVNLLWKDIKKIRPASLPGRVLPAEPRMEKGPDHWAIGQTTSDSGGKGTERFQGVHDGFLFFVLDEAEGVPGFVFDAVNAMMTGGRVILCLMLANPRTRSSRFHKAGQKDGVVNYRLSALGHPNVLDNTDTVPGATSRRWVEKCIQDWCEPVDSHDEDQFTFDVPWRPGVILKPNTEFLFRVMGVAPLDVADNTLITIGRYEAAKRRALVQEETSCDIAEMGVDVAGFGKDFGTLYVRHGRRLWRAGQFWKQDYDVYARLIGREALKLHAQGVRTLSLRIDAGGGFGQGVLSHVKKDEALHAAFEGARLRLHEVHFGRPAHDGRAFADVVTELYAQAGETLQGICLEDAPDALEADLCERQYGWVNRSGVEVKKLEEKDAFRRRHSGRSPDDGDGFVLCAAPEYLFGKRQVRFY